MTGVQTCALPISGIGELSFGGQNEREGAWPVVFGDFAGGAEIDSDVLAADILKNPLLSGVTFSGGEPFCQAEALCAVADALGGQKRLMAYTGYTFEQLLTLPDPFVLRLLSQLDLLVDGRFVEAERNISLRFRGSENQRVLDVPASLAAGTAVWNETYR